MTRYTMNKSDNMVWHIAIYIRLSKEDGNDESMSVTNQRKIILDYLEHYFEGEYIVVDEYVDDGKTGTDYDRQDFQRMLTDIEAGKVDCIVCKTLSRAFRNYADQGYFLESYFPRHNVRFISVGNPAVDSFLNAEAVFQGLEIPINGLLNDRYAAKTSADVRRTLDMKRRNGEFIGAFAPYGYKKSPDNKNLLLPDEETAPIVRDIFLWFVNGGMSKRNIAMRLNSLGVPNPTLYKHQKGFHFQNARKKDLGLWSDRGVDHVLKNEVYIGNMVQGKRQRVSYKVHDFVDVPKEEWDVVENTHEPIIDKDTFDKAQALHQHRTRTAPRKKEVYLFSGFLVCGDCDRALHRNTSKNHSYYYCRTHLDRSAEYCKNRGSIREDELKSAVLEAIQKQIAFIEDLSRVVGKINASNVCTKSKRLNALLNQQERELQKVANITDSLYADWKAGDITRTEYHRIKEKYTAQMEQLQQSVDSLQEETQALEQGVTGSDSYFEIFLKYRNITALDRGLLVALVENIYVFPDKTIRIDFKFQDQYKRIAEFIEANSQEENNGQGLAVFDGA